MKKYMVELTFEEISNFLADKALNDDATKVIQLAKDENKHNLPEDWMKEVINKSISSGELTWSRMKLGYCLCCDRRKTYAKYKSGRNKGRENYDKPLYLSGVEFNQGFIIWNGGTGVCDHCLPEKRKILIDYIDQNNLPIAITMRGYENGKVKDKALRCHSCDSLIYESEMGKERTLMNDGWYPCSCNLCGARQTAFGAKHKTTDIYRIINSKNEKETI